MRITLGISILIVFCLINIQNLKAFCHPDKDIDGNFYNVGFSVIDLNPEIGIPLAGYGNPLRRLKPVDIGNKYENCFFFRPSEGFHTPIRAKTMVIASDKQKLIFISLDVIGVEFTFVRQLCCLLSKYGVKEENIIVSATHTHSGPGTLSQRIPLQLVAVDLFMKKNYDDVLTKVAECVVTALDNLEPATLFSASFNTVGLQRNKFRKLDQQWYNPTANLLLALSMSKDQWIGGIVNYSIHGGGMPVGTMLYSSDFPGQIEIQLENKILNINNGEVRPVILFVNGAEGDVATPERGIEYIEDLGQKFILQADSALNNLIQVNRGIDIISAKLWLGIPALPLKFSSGDNSVLKNSPFLLRLSLFPFMPQYSYITLIKIGSITIFTWPGELSTELGFQLCKVAKENGYLNPWIFGLTNDYVSYFTDKQEFHEGVYDSGSSIYNFRGGRRILRHYDKLLNRN